MASHAAPAAEESEKSAGSTEVLLTPAEDAYNTFVRQRKHAIAGSFGGARQGWTTTGSLKIAFTPMRSLRIAPDAGVQDFRASTNPVLVYLFLGACEFLYEEQLNSPNKCQR